MMIPAQQITIETLHGDVAAILYQPQAARWLYVLAHGAGAGMRHRFMDDIAERLARRDIATLRYEYPYMTAGSKRPDPYAKLETITREVVAHAADNLPKLRLIAGGKSMGGRMTSQAQAKATLERVEGLVFLGFPLHPTGAPGTARAEHLKSVRIPMLFHQGTRDTLADLDLMRSVHADIADRATMHICDGADHGFAVLKRSGRSNSDVLDEIADSTRDWLAALGA
jgi:predicted alpha/beta-hydrolase family hydrolase